MERLKRQLSKILVHPLGMFVEEFYNYPRQLLGVGRWWNARSSLWRQKSGKERQSMNHARAEIFYVVHLGV